MVALTEPSGPLRRRAVRRPDEIGFLPIGHDHAQPGTDGPGRGMMERALAADAVVGYARAELMTGRVTAERVFSAARAGDPAAIAAVTTEARHLARLVASICAFLDPELIVLGGAIGLNLDLLEPAMTAALGALTPLQPRLARGALGTDVVVRGVAARGIAIARETAFLSQTERTA